MVGKIHKRECGLTKKAEPPPTRDVNRDSGTDSANGGWLRRLVRRQISHLTKINQTKNPQYVRTKTPATNCQTSLAVALRTPNLSTDR
jgi:hypothetical protein